MIIAWIDERVEAIYAQRISANGIVQWTADGVPIGDSNSGSVQIVSDQDGGAILAWVEGGGATQHDIVVQRIDSLGDTVWPGTYVVLCSAAQPQLNPRIVSDGAAGAIVSWEDSRTGATGLYARRVTSAGVPQWAANGVRLSPLSQSNVWDWISDSAGGGIITWSAGSQILAQRVSSAGSLLWGTGALVTAAGGAGVHHSAIDENGGLIVAWDAGNATLYRLFAQRLNASGVRQWTPSNGVPLLTAPSGITDSFEARPVSDGSAGAIVAWGWLESNGTMSVRAQRINSGGSVSWNAAGTTLLGSGAKTPQPQLAAASDGQGGAVVSWLDMRPPNPASGYLYAQRVDDAGTTLWPAGGVAICSSGYVAQPPGPVAPITMANQAAILAWSDTRNGDSDVFAQLVKSSGQLGAPDALAGNYDIGAAQPEPFNTLTGALNLLSMVGVSAAVTFTLIDPSYTAPNETFPITINPFVGASSANTLTIRPGAGVSATISGSVAGAVIRLNGADHVTIDGSDGASPLNLTIRNTSTAAGTAGVWVSSLGADAGSTLNTVKNCNIQCGVDQTVSANETFGIISSGSSVSTSSDGQDNDANIYMGNTITKCRWGIYLRGAAGNLNENNLIEGNVVGPPAFGSDQVSRGGIVIVHQDETAVIENEVRFVGCRFGDTPGGADRVGIGLGSASWTPSATALTSCTVARNLIHDIVEEKTFSAVGIIVAGTGSPSANTVANNMIFNVRANGAAADQAVGIGIGAGDADIVAYNSISMTGDIDPGSTTSALHSAAGVRISSATAANLTLKNNISSVDVNSNTATLEHYAIIAPSTGYAWGSGGLDHNDYYVNSANAQMVLGGIGTGVPYANVLTLADWRTQFTPNQDAASISDNPPFVSSTDLHIRTDFLTPLDSGGTPLVGIGNDIDGEGRGGSGAMFFWRFDGQGTVATDPPGHGFYLRFVDRATDVPVPDPPLAVFGFNGDSGERVVTGFINDVRWMPTAYKLYVEGPLLRVECDKTFDVQLTGDPGGVPGWCNLLPNNGCGPFFGVSFNWESDNLPDSERPEEPDDPPQQTGMETDEVDIGADEFTPDDSGSGIADLERPARTYLAGNYPNPSSQRTTIAFGLHETTVVGLEIFDVSGRLVRTLMDGMMPAGSARLDWDGLDKSGQRVASGFYLLRMKAGGKVYTHDLRIVR